MAIKTTALVAQAAADTSTAPARTSLRPAPTREVRSSVVTLEIRASRQLRGSVLAVFETL
jgi:hypothetical protein